MLQGTGPRGPFGASSRTGSGAIWFADQGQKAPITDDRQAQFCPQRDILPPPWQIANAPAQLGPL